MERRIRFYLPVILLLGMIAVLLSYGYSSAEHPLREGPYAPLREGPSEFRTPLFRRGEILVRFKEGVNERSARGVVIDEMGLSILSTSRFSRVKRLRVPAGREKMWIRFMRDNPQVEYAEPNYTAWAFFSPNDSYYPFQWHLDDNCGGCYNPYGGVNGGGINAEPAWDISTGSGVTVAVLDTGVAYEDYTEVWGMRYYKAPDLAGTSFVPGYDFVSNDAHPNDDNGHGTHVTGTIAQSTNNGMGVAGVAFMASIMPVKVLNGNGSGTYADIADGIYFAADNGAKVINLSLGGPNPSSILEDALAYAYGKGVTIVAASGNDGNGLNRPMYPAAYDSYVIAVGATRYDETRSSYSNTGSYVDMAAPGGDLRVDQNSDGYGDGILQQTFNPYTKRKSDFGYWFLQGTSMAAPHVSGVAALVIANGTTGPDQVRDRLESTAEDKGVPFRDDEYGWGIVDAFAALGYSPVLVHDLAVKGVETEPPSPFLRGDDVTVNISVANQGDFYEAFVLTLEDTIDGVTIGSEDVALGAGETTTRSFTWYTEASSVGDHTLKATASEVPEETATVNNSGTLMVTVNEPSHDVAVSGIDAPSSTTIGTTVSLKVSVRNEGTYSESTTVSLIDNTAGLFIGSYGVTLSAGETRVLTFEWDTTDLDAGDHLLEAEASPVTDETDTLDNSMTTSVTLTQGDTISAISVKDISTSIRGLRRNWKGGKAYVTVVDGTGAYVAEAMVSGEWTLNGVYLNTDTDDTNRRGRARLRSNKVRAADTGDTFEFCVTGIVKEGYTYTPSSNVETCGTVTVP